MAAEAAPPLPASLPEGDWAALLDRIKGGDDSESLEPLAHQLYAAVSSAGLPPPLRPRAAVEEPVKPAVVMSSVCTRSPTLPWPPVNPIAHPQPACLQGLADPAEAAAVIASCVPVASAHAAALCPAACNP